MTFSRKINSILIILLFIAGCFIFFNGKNSTEEALIGNGGKKNGEPLKIELVFPLKSINSSTIVCVIPPYGVKVSEYTKDNGTRVVFDDGVEQSGIDEINRILSDMKFKAKENEHYWFCRINSSLPS